MRTFIYSGSKPQISGRSKAGFTLIEILVTLGIMVLLSSIMVGYSAESGRQTFLLLTRESVVQLLNRARANSLSAYSPSGSSSQSGLTTCGYGLHMDRSAGVLSVFKSEAVNCDRRAASGNFNFSSSTDVLLTGSLDSYTIDPTKLAIVSDPKGNLTDVVFTSPNVQTYIYTQEDSSGQATYGGISLQLKNAAGENLNVNVNNAGQISWQ